MSSQYLICARLFGNTVSRARLARRNERGDLARMCCKLDIRVFDYISLFQIILDPQSSDSHVVTNGLAMHFHILANRYDPIFAVCWSGLLMSFIAV
jgi:hypothetical protein